MNPAKPLGPSRRNSDKGFLAAFFKNKSIFIYTLILAVLTSGISGSWLFYRELEKLDHKRVESEFKLQADALLQVVERTFEKNLDALRAVTTFLEVSPNITQQSFSAFVNYLLASNPDIYTIEWIPKVDGTQRSVYEAQVRQEGSSDFKIWDVDEKGQRREAEIRSEYYPILYAEPHQRAEKILGIDYSTENLIKPALRKAVRTRRKTATPVTPLSRFQEGKLKDIYGLILFAPVLQHPGTVVTGGDGPKNLVGLTATSFHVHSMISYAMKTPNTFGIRIQLETYSSQKKRLAFVYENSSAPEKIPENVLMQKLMQKILTKDVAADLPSLFVERKIEVADQNWRILCTPTKEFFIAKRRWESKAMFAFGVLLTLFAVAYLFMLEQKRLQEVTLKLSLTDELTGIYNRRGFLWLAEKEIRHARWHKKRLILIQGDLDYLKKINDVYGHAEGDAALSEAGAILRSVFRHSDIIGRLGGDEFAVLLLDVTKLTAEVALENLKKQFSVHNFNSGHPYKVRLSAGAAVFDPAHPCNLQDLMNLADKELYRQKQHRPSWPS